MAIVYTGEWDNFQREEGARERERERERIRFVDSSVLSARRTSNVGVFFPGE